jgi:ABC-type antimicrobial peptide transport system permease subunit
MTFEIRTAGDPMSLAGAVRDVVRQTDPRLAVHDLKSQAVHVDEAISREITLARLGSMFGGLALLIACVGVYGTVNFGVARRTNEIGIRLALGAPASRVVGMMMREALLAAGLGLAIGLAMSLALAKYARALLYGIEPTDPVSIAAAVGVLLIGGLLAAFVPARRATRIDPLAAVRED